jgi:hypothetical protein
MREASRVSRIRFDKCLSFLSITNTWHLRPSSRQQQFCVRCRTPLFMMSHAHHELSNYQGVYSSQESASATQFLMLVVEFNGEVFGSARLVTTAWCFKVSLTNKECNVCPERLLSRSCRQIDIAGQKLYQYLTPCILLNSKLI